MTGNPVFLDAVTEEFARAVYRQDFEGAERLATVAFGVHEAREALKQLEAERSGRRREA
jgi:hypothetical protein